MVRLLRLDARVTLDDPGPTLTRAQEAANDGDESWERWVAEYRAGEALILRLDLSLEFSADSPDTLRIANSGVFVERHPDPPKVEQQIAEVASKDFSYLARELIARGHDIGERELSDIYVHVELGEDVRRALADTAPPSQHEHSRAPQADVRLSRPEDASA